MTLRLTLVIGLVLLLSLFLMRPAGNGNHVPTDALSSCFTQSQNTRAPDSSCLRTVVAELLVSYTPEQILAAAYVSSSPDAVLTNCHAIGHVVGQEEVKRTKSLEQTLSSCPFTCGHGCTHGAIGEEILRGSGATYAGEDIAHASVSEMEIAGKQYCDQQRPLCHGIGHALFIATREYDKSLAACDKVGTSVEKRNLCYEGIFMESAGSVQSLYFGTSTLEFPPNDYAYPCSVMQAAYRRACFLFLPGFQYDRFKKDGITTTTERLHAEIRVCQSFSGNVRASCFRGIGYDGGVTQGNFKEYTHIKEACSGLEGSDKNVCVVGVVMKYMFYDRSEDAIRYCSSLSDEDAKAICHSAYEQRSEVL